MARQTDEDSSALKVLDDSRALDLHIASVKDRDANAKHGIDFMTAAGWRGDGSRYCMSIQSQLDVIRSEGDTRICAGRCQRHRAGDRKSTRLNSSHGYISYAVFCLKKKTHHALAGPGSAVTHSPHAIR